MPKKDNNFNRHSSHRYKYQDLYINDPEMYDRDKLLGVAKTLIDEYNTLVGTLGDIKSMAGWIADPFGGLTLVHNSTESTARQSGVKKTKGSDGQEVSQSQGEGMKPTKHSGSDVDFFSGDHSTSHGEGSSPNRDGHSEKTGKSADNKAKVREDAIKKYEAKIEANGTDFMAGFGDDNDVSEGQRVANSKAHRKSTRNIRNPGDKGSSGRMRLNVVWSGYDKSQLKSVENRVRVNCFKDIAELNERLLGKKIKSPIVLFTPEEWMKDGKMDRSLANKELNKLLSVLDGNSSNRFGEKVYLVRCKPSSSWRPDEPRVECVMQEHLLETLKDKFGMK